MTEPARGAPLNQIIFDGIGNLRALGSETFLAIFGIIIGTAAVIAILHVGHNARAEAMRQFEALGTDLISIVLQGDAKKLTRFSADVVRSLPCRGLGLSIVVPVITSGTLLRFGRASLYANLVAADEALYGLMNATVVSGRQTSQLDKNAPFVVLGADLARTVENDSGRPLRIGNTVMLSDQVLVVIGILGRTSYSPLLGLDLNRAAVIPFEAAHRLIAKPGVTRVAARLVRGADDQKTARHVTDYLYPFMRSGSVRVETARQLINSLQNQMRIYDLLLFGIGSVSLVVSGAGVMNVMLMSVMKRRREIGLRLAIGARRRDIGIMFLAEALVLSALGSLLGTGLGTFAGWIFARSSNWPFLPAPMALPLGAGMAVAVGLFFGYYPADRAARLNPISALRSE